jgi:hypothetical protein
MTLPKGKRSEKKKEQKLNLLFFFDILLKICYNIYVRKKKFRKKVVII